MAFETEADRMNEEDAMRVFLRTFACDAYKLEFGAFADYELRKNGQLRGYVEIKTRKYTMHQIDRMGGYNLALQKWEKARRTCNLQQVQFVLLLNLADGVYYHITRDFQIDDCLSSWGRKDRNHVSAIEPAIVLKAHRFAKL